MEKLKQFAEKLDKYIVGKYPVEEPITNDIRQKIIELLKEYVGGDKENDQ